MNILFISHSGNWGGAQKSLISYINFLRDQDAPVNPIFIFSGKGDFYQHLIDSGYTCYILKLVRITMIPDTLKTWIWWILRLFTSTVGIMNLIRRHKIDLVHTNTVFNFQGALAAWLTRRRHVWHIREDITMSFYTTMLSPNRYIRSMVRLSDILICISELEANMFPDRSKIRVIYNTWQVEGNWDPPPRKFREDTPVRFAQIGTIYPIKNQEWFIQSFIQLCRANDNCEAYLIGKQITSGAEYQDSIKNLIEESGYADRIHVVPFTTDIGEWYARIDVMVNSMLRGIVGRITLESMAYGIPCIGNDGGLNQGILEDNREGILVDFNDVQRLTDAMQKMMDISIRQEMGARAYIKAREQFDQRTYGSQILKIHSTLISGGE